MAGNKILETRVKYLDPTVGAFRDISISLAMKLIVSAKELEKELQRLEVDGEKIV